MTDRALTSEEVLAAALRQRDLSRQALHEPYRPPRSADARKRRKATKAQKRARRTNRG